MKESKASRPKILVLASTFPRWENDTEPAFVLELSRRFCEDCEVTVLVPRTPGSKKQETMAGMRIIRFPYFIQRFEKLAMSGGGILNRLKTNPLYYLMVPIFLAGQIWALVRLLKREKFDLVHAHWLIPQGITAVIALKLTMRSIPLLCTSHGGDLFALRGGLLQKIKKWVIDKSQGITVVSSAMKKKVMEMGIEACKIDVISMGVDLQNLFTPKIQAQRSDHELLFVGRLVDGKGVEVLFKAMPRLIDQDKNIILSIAGAGPLESELRKLAREMRISTNVNFLGMVKQAQLPDLYRRATLAVFPFKFTKNGVQEGFGLVVVEAMGCECPVIAGDLPAIHDSITHEENGLLVPPGKTEALADTILRALNDSDLRLKLATEGRKCVVGKFDWEGIAKEYMSVYEKLMAGENG